MRCWIDIVKLQDYCNFSHSFPFSFYLQFYHESNLMTSAKLLNFPFRTGRPASQLREPRTLLVYYLSQGVSEFDWGAAGPATPAANPAAATQPTLAAGASREVRSQAKNQAFPSFLILQASLRCPGLVYIPSPGSMSRCISKFFSQKTRVFIPKVAQEFTGRARCLLRLMANKNGRNLSLFTGVSEFGSWARCASWAAGDPGR